MESSTGRPPWPSSTIGRAGLLLALAVVSYSRYSVASADESPPSEYLEQLKQLSQAYEDVVREQERLTERAVGIRQQAGQGELRLQELTRNAAQLANEAASIRAELAERRDSDDPGARGSLIIRELQNRERRLQNEFVRLDTLARQTRRRLAELQRDHDQIATGLGTGQSRAVDLWTSYARLADTFGRRSRSEHETAVRELDTVLARYPDHLGARLLRGVSQRRLGELDAAEQDLTFVCDKASPLQAIACAARGELRMVAGRGQAGRLDIGEATRLTSKRADARVLLYRAWVLCGEEKFTAAETELTKALRVGGSDADAHRLLAFLHTAGAPSQIDAKRAVEHAEHACELTDYQDWLSLEALAVAYAGRADFGRATEAAERAESLAGGELRLECRELVETFAVGNEWRMDWKRMLRRHLPSSQPASADER